MRVIQINLNHCEAAQDLLTQMSIEQRAEVVLICDPFRVKKDARWCCSKDMETVIWTRKHPLQEIYDQVEGFVRAKVDNIYMYSCYAPPRWTRERFETFLDDLTRDVEVRSPVVIGGDFNAWATEWGSRLTNARGRSLLEAIARVDISIANNGCALTYRKAGTGSIIDLTLVSSSLLQKIKWRVSEEFTHSDHQAILFELSKNKRVHATKPVGPRWNDRKMDTEAFGYALNDQSLERGTASEQARQLKTILSKACDAAMPIRRPNRQGAPCYWWTEEIAQLRRICLKARRKMQRSRGRACYETVLAHFRKARKALQEAIKKSKVESFKQLCNDADINPWGTAYKMALKKLAGQRAPSVVCPVMLNRIVVTLFPQGPSIDRLESADTVNTQQIPVVSVLEIMEACKKIGDRKTPGPDGIPNVALKAAIRLRPEIFVAVLQKCLDEGVFPAQWKLQRLVLIPKGKGAADDPSSYRPICLLDTTGKILERIICNRLLPILEEKGALSTMQFGFRRNRSTIDAITTVVKTAIKAIEGKRWRWGTKEYCAVTTLDVKNAFNSASWSHILNSLYEIGIPLYLLRILRSYFSDRELMYESSAGTKMYKVTAGVPQGSVLGPVLWNIMYDKVLRLPVPREVRIIGFADDIAIVTVAKHIQEVEQITNGAIKQVKDWLEQAGLKLAEQKTEAVLITSRKKVEHMKIRVGEQIVHSQPALKYLGVIIDCRLNFKAHIDYAVEKTASIQAALSRILPNIGGPKSTRRKLLANVATSVLLYAAPVWANAAKLKDNKRKLLSVYRLSALRACCGYRTISDDAAFVIAGMIPADILASEMKRVYDRCAADAEINKKAVRAEERLVSLTMWQDRWNTSSKGRWTYKLIPDLRPWLNRSLGDTTYHVTQFLSGHGGFRKYLHRFGHDDSPYCPVCTNVEEDVEHASFHCPRFITGRTIPSATDVVEFMLQSEEKWEEVAAYATRIQKELRYIEQMRRTSR